MRKAKPASNDSLRAAYKHSDFGKMVRGKYASQFAKTTNVTLLDPSVSKAFPNDQAVNDALRSLMNIAAATATRPIRATKRPLRSRA